MTQKFNLKITNFKELNEIKSQIKKIETKLTNKKCNKVLKNFSKKYIGQWVKGENGTNSTLIMVIKKINKVRIYHNEIEVCVEIVKGTCISIDHTDKSIIFYVGDSESMLYANSMKIIKSSELQELINKYDYPIRIPYYSPF